MILRLHAVDAQAGHAASAQSGSLVTHHAGVAVGAEVLRRVEAEAADRAEGAGPLALVLGPDRLGASSMIGRSCRSAMCQSGVHVGALAEEMDDHDRPRPRRDLVLDLERVEVVR